MEGYFCSSYTVRMIYLYHKLSRLLLISVDRQINIFGFNWIKYMSEKTIYNWWKLIKTDILSAYIFKVLILADYLLLYELWCVFSCHSSNWQVWSFVLSWQRLIQTIVTSWLDKLLMRVFWCFYSYMMNPAFDVLHNIFKCYYSCYDYQEVKENLIVELNSIHSNL